MNTFVLKVLAFTVTFIFISSNYKLIKGKILFIEESSSIVHNTFVQIELLKKADIFHNQENAIHTGTALQKIEEWIVAKYMDITFFHLRLQAHCNQLTNAEKSGKKDKINEVQIFSTANLTSNYDFLDMWMKMYVQARLFTSSTTYLPNNEEEKYNQNAVEYNKQAKI